jgi:hypothetical protein
MKDSNLNFNHEFDQISHAQLMGLIPPSYSEVSINDTQEHPLGVYLEKNDCILILLKLNDIILLLN